MKFKTVAKKMLSAALAGAMVLSLAACGGGGSSDGGSGAKDDAKSESGSGSGGDGVTLKFQQWWGAELPEGYLDEIVAKYK